MAAARQIRAGADPFASLTQNPSVPNATQTFEGAIPGFGDLTSTATSNIKNLLSGLPSVDQTRLDNAYFGAGTGLNPTSPFLINRGRGLYGERAEQQRQTGLQNFLSLIGQFSGNVVPNVGQQQQQSQFGQNLAFQGRESAASRASQESLAEQQLREQQRQFDIENNVGRYYRGPNYG